MSLGFFAFVPMLIQSAGRTFSRKNQERMTALWKQLADLLIDSGLVSPTDLAGLLENAQKQTPETEGENATPETPAVVAGKGEKTTEVPEEVAAQGFTDEVKSITWFDAVKRSLDIFKARFLALHRISDAEIEKRYGVNTNRTAQATQMISEITAILNEQCEVFPGANNDRGLPYPMMADPYYDHELPPLYAQAADAPEGEKAVETPVVAEPDKGEESTTPDREEIQASEIDLTLVCATEISAANQRGNRLPIEGVLFRVDEASESAPAKGSKLPLYVPREVAELAAIAVNESKGLPIDIDDSLSKHANEQIVGVYTEAEIDGNDFVVRGHAFPWSQPERVRLISANKERLGMSMNAHAVGHPAVVDGVDVFWIDVLELLGANILYSDRATYQQTRLVAAQANDDDSDIDARKKMEIEEQLKNLGETLKTINAASQKDSEKIESMHSQFETMRRELSEIQAERNERAVALQAQAAQETSQKQNEALIMAIAEKFNERLEAQKAELLDVINPSRQPRRITQNLVSLTASSGPATNQQQAPVDPRYVEFIQASSKLEGFREAGFDGVERMKLVEQVSSLKRELGIA